MKKAERQQLIKQVISQQDIETQDELLMYLKKAGVTATQATISRDVREMRVIKSRDASGKTKYALFTETSTTSLAEKLKEAVQNAVQRIECIQFLIVMHTELGGADLVTNLLDQIAYAEIAGTVAGVDTIIVITRSVEDAQRVTERLHEMKEN